MTTDRFGDQVRTALGTLGDAALPPRPFHVLVDGPAVRGESRPLRTRLVTGAVFALAACVVALLVWSGGSDPVATGDGPSLAEEGRWHAVPLYLPDGMAFFDAGSGEMTGALGAEPGPPAVDTLLRYASASANVHVVSGRARPLEPMAGARPIDLPGGIVGDVTVDSDTGTRLRWVQPDGPVVLLMTYGIELDEVLDIASSMWFVTDDRFAELTEHAGFLPPAEEARGFDAWTPPGDADADVDVHVAGSLQTGFGLRFGGTGIGLDGRPVDRCVALSTDGPHVVLVGPPGTQTFLVSEADGTAVVVPAASPPGLPGRVAGRWRSDVPRSEEEVVVRCEGAGQ